MAVMKYCIRDGVVEATHRCTRDGFVGTENQIRYRKNKQHGTHTATLIGAHAARGWIKAGSMKPRPT